MLGDPKKRRQYDELTRSPEASDDVTHEMPPNHVVAGAEVQEKATVERLKLCPGCKTKSKGDAYRCTECGSVFDTSWRWAEERASGQNDSAARPSRPSRVESVATHATSGFSRVIGWILGFAIVSAIVAVLHDRFSTTSDHVSPAQVQTAAPTPTATAQWVWTTQHDYRIAFPEGPEPAPWRRSSAWRRRR